MTTAWTGFPAAAALVTGDVLVGLAGGTTNARFTAVSVLKAASNLSDVASDVTSFDNISPTTTLGDLIINDGTNNVRLAIGSANTVLISNGTTAAWTANPGLLKASNLSDLTNAATARTNIGLGVASNVAFLNVFAGNSGNAGVVRSYSSSATAGYLGLTGVANSGDFSVIISNASHAQNTVLSIPDGGQTSSSLLITNSASTQTIATGNLAMTLGLISLSPVNGLTAHAGGGQGSATALTRQVNRVTTVATAADSVLLPAAVAGKYIVVINAAAANAMNVFPTSGDAINALTANTALSVAANKVIVFYCAVTGTWNSLLTA